MDTMLKIPKLNNWAPYKDVLVGEAIDHPEFENRQRVMTNKCLKLEKEFAICTNNEVWQLGQKGNLSNYVDPLTKKFF